MRESRVIEEFTLNDHEGEPWSLGQQVASGRPVALFTFRGAWCPFDVRNWHGLAALVPFLTPLDVPLLGISADDAATLAGFRMRLALPFRMLSDPRLVAARRLGVSVGRRHPKARTYPAGGFLQPGFVVIGPRRRLLYEWQPESRAPDGLEAAPRPMPTEMVEAIRLVTKPGHGAAAKSGAAGQR